MGQIDSFVQRVRQRLTLRQTLRAILWSGMAAGGALLVAALIYIVQGYEVPRIWYWGAAIGALAGAVFFSTWRRPSLAQASEYADDFFKLKDSVTSARRFQMDHRDGGFYELQLASTSQATAALRPTTVPCRPSAPLTFGSLALMLAAGLTAFVGPSSEVQARMAREEATLKNSEQAKEELLKELEEITKGMEEGEKELLKPDELKKWIEQLKATKDIKDAMRQLSELERKLNDTAKSLAIQKREEALLKKAGEELQKEEDPDARELGKQLEAQKYKDAADKLKDMKPSDEGKLDKEKLQQQKANSKEQMDKERKELAKLKAAAKRMAAAARQMKNDRKKSNQHGNLDADADEMDEELEDLLEELEEATEDLEEAMEEEDWGEVEKCRIKLGEKGDKLGKKLLRLNAKKNCQGRLAALANCLGRCQSQYKGKGGLQAGVGRDDSRRKEKDELKDNGQYAQIKGQKNNQGPSISRIEDAEDGTGTSHRKVESKGERNFQKQLESFINRDDIPEEVKDGVKSYFNALHEGGEKLLEDKMKQEGTTPAETAAPATPTEAKPN